MRRSSEYFVLDGEQLVDDELHQPLVAGENASQMLDRLQQLGELVENLLPLEPGQALQLHLEDGLRLQLREAELAHQAVTCLGRALRPADQRDDGIEVIERDPQPLEDVRTRLRLAQLELDAAAHDLAAELDELLDELEQVQHARPSADDREHDDAEARLQGGVLVQVVQHHLRHLAALHLDHDAHAVAIRLVAQVGDALDDLVAHQVGDLLDQARLVDLIRDLARPRSRSCRPSSTARTRAAHGAARNPRPVRKASTMPCRPTM